MTQDEKMDLAYYLAEIDGLSLDEWLEITDNTKKLRAIDKLRMFYYAQYKAKDGA